MSINILLINNNNNNNNNYIYSNIMCGWIFLIVITLWFVYKETGNINTSPDIQCQNC